MTIGWWAGTLRLWDGMDEGEAAWAAFGPIVDVGGQGSRQGARSIWYRKSWTLDDGSASVLFDGVGGARGTIMLTLRQALWERLTPVQTDRTVRDLSLWHASRVDLAADGSRSSLLSPSSLYSMLAAARSRSRPEHRVLTQNWAGGETLTVGARASARYLRVYVKGERIRHELELKQDAAEYAWLALTFGSAPADVWREQYGRLVQWR